MLSFTSIFLAGFFVGGALAQQFGNQFNISLDGNLTQVDIMHLIDFPNPPVDAVTSCQSDCSTLIQLMQACDTQQNKTSCFCTTQLQTELQTCEQCMFNFLVAKNIKQPSPVVGSNPALAGLIASCGVDKVTLPKVALAFAPNWDGPLGVGLNLGETIVVVGTGFLFGVMALFTFATIDIPSP